MNAKFRLPVNNTGPNQAALQWLVRAKAQYNHVLLYLLQLAFWGLEKGVQLQAEVSQEDLQDQVNLLLAVKKNAATEQAQAYRWLLANPNGPPSPEQSQSLENALLSAKGPLEAAGVVLETVSARMAAANASTQE